MKKRITLILCACFALSLSFVSAQTSFIKINEDNKGALNVPPFKIVTDVVDVPTGEVKYTLVELIDADHYYPAISKFDYLRFSFDNRAAAIEFFEGLYQFLGTKPTGTIVTSYEGYSIVYSKKTYFTITAPSTWMDGGEGSKPLTKKDLDWIIKSLKM